MKLYQTSLLGLFLLFQVQLFAQIKSQIEVPSVVISGLDFEVKVHHKADDKIAVYINDERLDCTFNKGYSSTLINISKESELEVVINNRVAHQSILNPIPGWMSILPPLLAIILALVFREVILSLFLGIFTGCLIPAFYSAGIGGLPSAFLSIIDTYLINALNDSGHISVILFSMLIGATVSLISKNGGMAGIVNRLSKYAKSRRSGQFVTWLLGVLIFFDDYANTLIVGNTMRPVSDRLSISREKLSYIVDSTAAPMAAIAFVTTWIGAELGYIEDGLKVISGIDSSVYQIFLNSLQYSFYPVFTLLFILMLIWMKRDFGPMLRAEKKVVESGHVDQPIGISENEMKDFEPDEDIPKRAFNAIIPVATIVFVTIGGLLYSGWDSEAWNGGDKSLIMKISDTIGRADAYLALLWSSISGLAIAAILGLIQRILNLEETVNSVLKGFKTMLTAMVILILAWALSAVTVDLHTATYLADLVSGNISPYALPATTFILAAFVSFSTGSSWGTMAILYPMMLPLSWTIAGAAGLDHQTSLDIFYNVTSCVLAGSVLGDHCSPISDTTILSSLASSCNHIDHVRTQLPYALTVGFVSILLGSIPSAFGLPFILSFGLGISAMYLIIRKFGVRVE